MMMKTILLASSLIVLGMAVSAQSITEKTGVNAALGIAPNTQDFVSLAAQGDMLEIETSKLAKMETM